jgi:hypothetical protein
MDRVVGPQNMVGTGIFSRNPPYRAFPAAGDPRDRRRQTVPPLRLRPSVLRSIRPRPHGDLKLSQGWRLLASAVPSGASQLSAASSNTLVPPLIRPYPSSPKKYFANAAPAPSSGEYLRLFRHGKDISDWPSGRSCAGVRILCFSKTLRTGLPDSC